jgi:hypothetical protein
MAVGVRSSAQYPLDMVPESGRTLCACTAAMNGCWMKQVNKHLSDSGEGLVTEFLAIIFLAA